MTSRNNDEAFGIETLMAVFSIGLSLLSKDNSAASMQILI